MRVSIRDVGLTVCVHGTYSVWMLWQQLLPVPFLLQHPCLPFRQLLPLEAHRLPSLHRRTATVMTTCHSDERVHV